MNFGEMHSVPEKFGIFKHQILSHVTISYHLIGPSAVNH